MKNYSLLIALIISIMILVVTGCPSGSVQKEKEKEIELPDNYFRINGTVFEIDHVSIQCSKDERTVAFFTKADELSGYRSFINFINMGDDWTQVENHFPLGTWTAIDNTSLTAAGYANGVATATIYTSSSTWSNCALTVGGVRGSLITVNGSFAFTSGSGDNITIVYSGAYGISGE